MKSLFLLFGVLAVFPLRSDLSAQCCTAGNPVNTNSALTDYGKNILNVSYSYLYSYSSDYFAGTKRLDKTYAESYYDYSSIGLSYGISATLKLTADIGYFFDKSQRFVTGDYTRYATGISDGTLGVQYKTYASENSLFEFQQTAKITIPVGKFDQEYDGVVLPIDFQPSSGNYRYNLGFILSKRFRDSDFSLMSFGSVEMSQAIETKNTYHKYGNLYNVSVLGGYRIAPSLLGILQLRFEARDRALNGALGTSAGSQTNGGQFSYINSSGGVVAYVSPQITVSFFRDWMMSFQYNYPVYKNVYGEEQLTNRHSISAVISHSIDFGGGEPDPDALDQDLSLSTVDLHVRGNCDMCKSRIEHVAASLSHVHTAAWNPDTEILTVTYEDTRPSTEEIETALAKVGHDTDTHKAPDEVYNKLPACCLYR